MIGVSTSQAPACRITRQHVVRYNATIGARAPPQKARQLAASAASRAPGQARKAMVSSDPEDLAKMQPTDTAPWIALLCNTEWLLHDVNNESFAEQLRERVRLYSERDLPLNFYLVSEPAWLQELFPEQAAKIKRPAVALVCPDRDWMTYLVHSFVQIRLDRVLRVELPATMTVAEVTSSQAPVPRFADYEGWRAPYAPYAQGWWQRFEYTASA